MSDTRSEELIPDNELDPVRVRRLINQSMSILRDVFVGTSIEQVFREGDGPILEPHPRPVVREERIFDANRTGNDFQTEVIFFAGLRPTDPRYAEVAAEGFRFTWYSTAGRGGDERRARDRVVHENHLRDGRVISSEPNVEPTEAEIQALVKGTYENPAS